MFPGIATSVLPVAANEIENRAFFGGDNLTNQATNRAVFSAEVAALQIAKTANKVVVQPGDTVLYRITIRNVGNVNASNLTLTDTLPLGLVFDSKSLQASLSNNSNNSQVSVSATQSSNGSFNVTYAGSLAPQGTLNIVYAATITPDGMRGNGRNLAVATAGSARSNTASHQLKIRPGLLSNCGTLIGRVFVDKNFDGEQQPGEPGIPNAVIYMDDGNRIITDTNGMFSVANVIAGNRTGTLDLTSLPGYIQAPNLYRIDKNSQSRLVKLAPFSMGRMNFAVTPAFGEERQ
ncbi:hypothetical protein NIES4071_23940 [Calothrix sp. NIES-4071]|nr:hypothetical protein NIES4071_23940 [Calothrix sp. NIES-4071]BAZ56717.1 hypothetical protein NIES4105_23880 [Calothrix sp. NIES-4105]